MLMRLKQLNQNQNRDHAVLHEGVHREIFALLNNDEWNANLNSQAPHALD
jgi:hypothetical protein